MRYAQPITLAPRGPDSLSFFLAPDGLTLDNRFLMAPVKTAYGTLTGRVTNRHLTYYANVARGGVSLVILEPVAVSPSGKEHPKQLTIHLDSSVSDLRRIVDLLHDQGTKACLNLNHAGRAANPKATGGPPLAPSAVTCPTTGQTPLELKEEQIAQILADYGEATNRAREAGFDAIEIQCGHGYLVSQFLSSRTNLREGAYGKDRTLFLRQLFETVRQHRGRMAVFVRISVSEFTEGGLTPEDNKPILELAERSGFDAVIVATGSFQNLPQIDNLDSQYWMTSLEFFESRKKVEGQRVLVIGAGMVGMEAAELLVNQGYEVTATKRTDTIANDMEMVTKKLMLRRLSDNPLMTIMPETTVLAFEQEGARIRHKGEEQLLPPFDTVIVASGMKPESSLATALEDAGIEVGVVGDADHPADIFSATQAGYHAALSLVGRD